MKIIKWSYQNHVLHLCPWVFPEVLWSFWGNFVPLPLGVVFTGQGIEVAKPQLEYSNDSILGGSIGHLENVQKKKVRRSKYSLWNSKSPGIILGPLRVLCLFFVFAQKIHLCCARSISASDRATRKRQAVYLEIVDITWGLSSLDNISLAFSSQVLNSHILVSSSAQSGCRLTTRSGGPDPNSIWQRRNPFGGESP